MMLKWKDEYAIGVKLIDGQHKYIFEIANNAYGLLKSEAGPDKYSRIVQVLEDLRQYTKYHFRWEEDYMRRINCPHAADQKAEHDDFIKKIDAFNLEDIDRDQDKAIEDLLFFILEWVMDHILLKDKLIKAQ